MDSEDEIPASQKPIKTIRGGRRRSVKALSLKSRRNQSNQTRSNNPSHTEPSTSHAATDRLPLDKVCSKNTIYAFDSDEDDTALEGCHPIIGSQYDVYKSAKLSELCDEQLKPHEIDSLRAARKHFNCPSGTKTARELYEMESNAVPTSSAHHMQNTSLDNILAEADNLLNENPLEKALIRTNVNNNSVIVQAILNDFDEELVEEPRTSSRSPVRLFVKKPNRKYTRKRRKYADVVATTQEFVDLDYNSANEFDCADDIDLNASFMIAKNIADLSQMFDAQLDEQKIEFELDDAVFERGSQSGDEAVEDVTSVVDSVVDSRISEMLNEDEDIFEFVSTPKVSSTANKRKHDSAIEPQSSTPITLKATNKPPLLQPKRLRFEKDHNAVASANPMPSVGFQTARGSNVNISVAKQKKSLSIFDDIMTEFGDIPTIGVTNDAVPAFSPAITFKSAKIDTRQLPPPSPAPSTSACVGFATARGTGIKPPANHTLQKMKKLFEFDANEFDALSPFDTSAIGGGGFTTAAGASINVSENTFQKYAALFEEEINENAFDANTSAMSSLFEETVVASPCNKPIPLQFATSTPFAGLSKMEKKSDQTEYLEFFNDAEDDFFHEVKWTQKPNVAVRKQFNPRMTSERVKQGRQEALVRQQANCLRKNKVRPSVGSLHKQKSTAKRIPLKSLGHPKSYSREELRHYNVPPNVITVNIENVYSFRFEMWRYYSSHECSSNIDGINLPDGITLIMDRFSRVGFDEMTNAFLNCDSVDPKLVPDNWIRNALKWIILKLAGYEHSYPHQYAGNGLTPANVMSQLKYRYDREIDRAQRSAIRKIVEQDDAVSKPLVLFVSRIRMLSPIEYSLELCDGWYAIGTSPLDAVLSQAVYKKKICVGTKLLIQDAELIGTEEPCSPLEMPASIALKFSANSTRRVKWHTRLGYFTNGRPIAFPMKSIIPHGGNICNFTAFIARVYPMLYVAKAQDTTELNNSRTATIIRSERVQRRVMASQDRKSFDIVEKLYEQISRDVEREYAERRNGFEALPMRDISEVGDAEELLYHMECSYDAESFEATLTNSQKRMITSYREKCNQEKNAEIDLRVKKKMSETDGSSPAKNLLKIRVVDADHPTNSRAAIISIYNVDESHHDLSENTFIDVTHVSANGMRARDLLITANNRSKIRKIHSKPMTNALKPIARNCFGLADVNGDAFKPKFNEFDVVAYVLHIENAMAETRFQTVHFVDERQHILHVKFWNGLKHYAVDDIIEEGKILVIANLEWRSQHAKSTSGWAQAYASDLTTFSANPKSKILSQRLREFSESFNRIANVNDYVDMVMSLIHERRDSGTPSSGQTSVLTVSNSPTNSRTLNDSNTENSSQQRTKRKIEMLSGYKSPPRIPKLVTRGALSSTLRRPFRSPMPSAAAIRNVLQNQENVT